MRTNILNRSNDPNHNYYNISVLNQNASAQTPSPLNFTDTRTSTFLKNAHEYFLSIIEFDIDTPRSLPVFRPNPLLGQTISDTLTTLQVGIVNTTSSPDVVYWYNVDIFNTLDDNISPPSPLPASNDWLANPRYWYFSYNNALRAINQFISTILTAIPYNPDSNFLTPPVVPYFAFDSNMNIQYWGGDLEWSGNAGTTWTLCFNEEFMNLISTMPLAKYYTKSPNVYDVSYNPSHIYYKFKQAFPIPATSSTPIILALSFITPISMWTPVKQLVFTTGSTPIFPTNISQPNLVGATVTPQTLTNGNNDNISNIITTFDVSLSATNNWLPQIVYDPTAEYRLFDLGMAEKLSQLSITVFWKDRAGNLYNFNLGQNCGAQIQILFRKKTFNMKNI